MGKKRWRQGFGGENQKNSETHRRGCRRLKWIFKIGWNCVYLIHVAQNREKWKALANMLMGPLVAENVGKLAEDLLQNVPRSYIW